MLIAVTASVKSAAQANRTAAAVNSVLMITAAVFADEYAGPAGYMSFDKRRKKNEKKETKKREKSEIILRFKKTVFFLF